MTNKRAFEYANAFMLGMESLDEYEELMQNEGQIVNPSLKNYQTTYKTEPLLMSDISLEQAPPIQSEKSSGPTRHPKM